MIVKIKFPDTESRDFYIKQCWPELTRLLEYSNTPWTYEYNKLTEVKVVLDEISIIIKQPTNSYADYKAYHRPIGHDTFFVLCNNMHGKQKGVDESGREYKGMGSGTCTKYKQVALMLGDNAQHQIRNTRKAKIVKRAFIYLGKPRKHNGPQILVQYQAEAERYNRFPLAYAALHYPEVLQALVGKKRRNK